ncbi:MAG: PEGA domain-containing protein [Vicinamibacterales bacterium]
MTRTLLLPLLLVMTAWPVGAEAQSRRARGWSQRQVVVVPVVGPSVRASWLYGPFGWYPPFTYGGRYDDSASFRLRVSPRNTEVYVDGYYAGVVDSYDGIFQRLRVTPGAHDVVLYLDGYRSLTRRVYAQPTGSLTLDHVMEPLSPGMPPEARPLPPTGSEGTSDRGGTPTGVEMIGPTGTLSLQVNPADAVVLIDGERWTAGSSGRRLEGRLPVGRHRLEVQRTGYASQVMDIELRRGETELLNLTLRPD